MVGIVKKVEVCHRAKFQKSLEPQPRYGDFYIFQDGGHRHLGFSKFTFFNAQNGQVIGTASLCQISSKSLELWPRYGTKFFDFSRWRRPPSWIFEI